MRLVTFVVTVELGSSLENTRNALEMALEDANARLPKNQWIPDTDTLTDAYDAEHMHVEILNP